MQVTLTLQDSQGVLWALLPDVASITPAYPNRWRVVLADGCVAYLLEEPPAGPWVRLGESWVNPRHLRRTGDGWQDPAGFHFPAAHLDTPPVWTPHYDLEYQVQSLSRVGSERWWHTDDGDRPCELTWREVGKLYPELVRTGDDHYVNRNRLRRVRYGRPESVAILDTGLQLTIRGRHCKVVARALGIDGLGQLSHEVPLLLSRTREYPYEISSADGERLRADFPERADLVLNLVWQAREYTQNGRHNDYGCDFESFLAHPVLTTVTRAGWTLTRYDLRQVLDGLNYERQLMALQDLGFEDLGPTNRHIGSRDPHVVLVAGGHVSMRPLAQALAQEAGISLYFNEYGHNAPTHLEYFFRQLSQVARRPLRWLAWVDFFPQAWKRVHHFRRQAERWGLELEGKTDFLALPACLSAEELKKVAVQAPGTARDSEAWLQEGGGIEGRALGFRAECLPEQRVRQRFQQLLNSVPIPLQAEIPVPAPDLPRTLPLEDDRRIRFVPYDQIAVLAPAYPNRWRADLADGTVAYHPGPLPAGPWVPMGECFVRPELLRREGNFWVSPVGFRFAYVELPPAPPVASGGELPGLPCPPDQILSVQYGEGKVTWQTDGGDQNCHWPLAEAARLHPALVWVSKTRFVNRHRIRRLHTNSNINANWLEMDRGEMVRISGNTMALKVANSLGLASFCHLEPYDRRMFNNWLRDFPFELARAKGSVLRAAFATPRDLIANFIYQAFLYRTSQNGPIYADSFRDFFYFPLLGALERAGFLNRSRSVSQEERFMLLFYTIFVEFVADYRFFTYEEFGFADHEAGNRLLGWRRPDIILLIEKDGIPEANARLLAELFGVTIIITGGTPSLMATEYFVKALRKLYAGPVRVIAYVDFDERGWVIARTFVEQLAFYGCPCLSLDTLVVPQCFTPEEIVLHAREIPLTTPAVATLVRSWVEATGGLNGQGRGLYLDLLQPYERVQKRFEEIISCY